MLWKFEFLQRFFANGGRFFAHRSTAVDTAPHFSQQYLILTCTDSVDCYNTFLTINPAKLENTRGTSLHARTATDTLRVLHVLATTGERHHVDALVANRGASVT